MSNKVVLARTNESVNQQAQNNNCSLYIWGAVAKNATQERKK